MSRKRFSENVFRKTFPENVSRKTLSRKLFCRTCSGNVFQETISGKNHCNEFTAMNSLQLLYRNEVTAVNPSQSIHCNKFTARNSLQWIHSNEFIAMTSLQSIHCNKFTAINSLQWIHSNEFPAINSLQSIHCDDFTAMNSLQPVHWKQFTKGKTKEDHPVSQKSFRICSKILKWNYKSGSPQPFVHFRRFLDKSETLFVSTRQNKCLTRSVWITFRADQFAQIICFIAPTWGRLWPIWVVACSCISSKFVAYLLV